VRQMTPKQLEEFASKVRHGVTNRPLGSYSSDWEMPTETDLQPLLDKYKEGSEQLLGLPFLAQLVFRVIADSKRIDESRGIDKSVPAGNPVTTDSTALLRRITEITVRHAGNSTDRISLDGGSDDNNQATGRRLYGNPLRTLLHKTAAKMTIAGRESVSHDELLDYLRASKDEVLIAQVDKAGGITGLLIAFFFKGGNTDLGCEFTHKALREYLFAEAVVEGIKQLARRARRENAKRDLAVRAHYWRDFSVDDPQLEWSKNLAELLAPQWLTWPVRNHILSLLKWEIDRSTAWAESEEATSPLTLEEWQYVRDGMADVYDWWAEGVPMRRQLAFTVNTETSWGPPYFETLIKEQFERPGRSDIVSVASPRLTTYDGHLASALMQLTAAVHQWVGAMILQTPTKREDVLRVDSQVQSQKDREPLRFRPGGGHSEYFFWYCDRINAAGWYRATSLWSQAIRFPSDAVLPGADLARSNLRAADFSGADLSGADLSDVDLMRADLSGADLRGADLTRANLSGAYLSAAKLNDAILNRAVLRGVYLCDAKLSGADLMYADLSGADLTRADLSGANLTGVDLSSVDLTVASPPGLVVSADGRVGKPGEGLK
jgi:Pentapeptide repeats (8 copies)